MSEPWRSAPDGSGDPVLVVRERSAPYSLYTLTTTGVVGGIAGTESLRTVGAAVSDNGAVLVVLAQERGATVLLRALAPAGAVILPTLSGVETSVSAIKAVSDDGDTIVFEGTDSLVVARVGGARTLRVVPTKELGGLVYGAALSPDGHRLAFSTAQRACPGKSSMFECPITLWALDLTLDADTPHAIATGESASYDPQFLDPRGDELLFMTNERDTSDACRAAVMACSFDIRRVRFDGSNAREVVADAVLARQSGEGSLVYLRPGRSTSGSKRVWSHSTLRLLQSGVDRELGDASGWIPRIAPGAEWVAAVSADGVVLYNRTGRAVRSPRKAAASPIGWLRGPIASVDVPPEASAPTRLPR